MRSDHRMLGASRGVLLQYGGQCDYRESSVIVGAYSIAQAKAHLSALVEQVARGETVTLTRRGKPVARIVSMSEPIAKPKIDLVRLRAFRATMPASIVNSAVTARKMRDREDGW